MNRESDSRGFESACEGTRVEGRVGAKLMSQWGDG
jgi:hypothetical protein